MKKLLWLFLLLSCCAAAQTVPADPCFSLAMTKNSVAINISTATTTQLIAPSALQNIYPCSIVITTTGATSATTAQLTYGTGATCGTGTVTLTGTFAESLSTTATVVTLGDGGSIFKPSASGAGMCLVSAGTTVSVRGWMTYVQL